MEFGLLGLTLLVVGIVTSIKWIARGGHSLEPWLKRKIREELEALADRFDSAKDKQLLKDYAESLHSAPAGQTPAPQTPSAAQAALEAPAATTHTPITRAPAHPHFDASEPAPPPNALQKDVDFSQVLHNINVLLYLGAFLIVVAASIFVGSQSAALTGWTKTAILAVFCLLFYGAGLGLYRNTAKIKPAGLTFTTIGLLTVPLVGLAAYGYGFEEQNAGLVWFVTSIAALVMHLAALVILRKTYVGYLTAFTGLSLLMSLVSVVEAPVYYFGWAMALTSILYLFLSRQTELDEDIKKPLQVSANIFIPASIALSLIFGEQQGWWQAGINLLLAAAFYFMVVTIARYADDQEHRSYFSLTLALVPAGVFSLAVDAWGAREAAWALLGVAAVYVAVSELAAKLPESYRRIEFTTVAFTSAAACLVVINRPGVLLYLLIAGGLLNAYLYARRRFALNYVFSLAAFSLAPYVWMQHVLAPAASHELVALVYLALSLLTIVLTYGWPRLRFDADAFSSSKLIYALQIAASIIFAVASGTVGLMAGVLGAVAAILLIVTYLEKADLTLLAALVSYLALYLGAEALGLDVTVLPYLFILLALVWLGLRFTKIAWFEQTHQSLTAGYITGLGLSFLVAVAASDASTLLATSSVLAVVLFAVSYLERAPIVVAASSVLTYIAVGSLNTEFDLEIDLPVLLLLTAAPLYGLGFVFDKERSEYLRASGLAGSYIAAFIVPFSERQVAPLVATFAAGGLTAAEASVRRSAALGYTASAVVVFGILRLYDHLLVRELQVYTVTLAVYFAALGYIQHAKHRIQNRDLLVAVSLGFLTLPLFLQALGNTDDIYSFALITEAVALVVVGIVLKYQLVMRWGAVSLVVIVLYQLRDFLLNIPTWAIYGSVGIAMLGGAIYLLSRRDD